MQTSSLEQLHDRNTETLKRELLQLVADRDRDLLNRKIGFYKSTLAFYFEELHRRNPFPVAEDQIALIEGIWTPVWSTIPFQDIIPGRIQDQSYQIFHKDGYYANAARYALGHKLPILKQLLSSLIAYDFMVIQRFGVQNGQWHITNVGIKQAFRFSNTPLDSQKADAWFTDVAASYQKNPNHQQAIASTTPEINLDSSIAKRVKQAFRATPQLEHLYMDENFRLVKTRREAKQRPSYTIAVRI